MAIQQTSLWARIQSTINGQKALDLEVKGKKIQVLIRESGLNQNWIYIPGGPDIDFSNEKELKEFKEKLQQLAKKHGSLFAKIETLTTKNPPHKNLQKIQENLKKTGFKIAHKEYLPKFTLVIDLNQSEEEILAQMKPKGRYNIRLAQKKNLAIKESTNIDDFYQLLTETTTRDGFQGQKKEYYKKLLETLGNKAKLYITYLGKEPIAALILTFHKDTATYYYGASSNKHRNLMAPYLLQWHAITESKKQGYKYYDFLGVADPNNPNDPLKGVSQFKHKFRGELIEYLPSYEYIFQPLKFHFFKFAKKVLGK